MKRIVIIALAVFAFAFASCQKDPIGGTAVQDASGQWYATWYFVTTSGELVEPLEIPSYGLKFNNTNLFLTYNTADNEPDKLFLDDLNAAYQWKDPDYGTIIKMYMDFKVKANLDPATLKFSAAEAENLYEENTLTLEGGIIKNGAKSAQGKPLDSIWISYKINEEGLQEWIEDPEDGLGVDGFDHFLITGKTYTGFAEDE